MTDAQTTFARATLEYDKAHERALLEAITRAIFESSTVSDANAIVIRTAEAAEALLTVLAGILAMSPSATRSPTAIRRTIDDLGKRLRRQIAAAEAERGSTRIYSPDVSRQRCGRDRMMRRVLPQRRRAETFAIVCRNQPVAITAGFYDDGALGEVFIDTGKSGADLAHVALDAAVVISLALQHGVSIEVIRHAVTRCNDGSPASILGAVVDCLSAIARGN